MAQTPDLRVDPDIRRAATIPAADYSDAVLFERIRDRVFARSWQLAADLDQVRTPRQAHPFSFLVFDATRSRDYPVNT